MYFVSFISLKSDKEKLEVTEKLILVNYIQIEIFFNKNDYIRQYNKYKKQI